jgi:hypothetical protein
MTDRLGCREGLATAAVVRTLKRELRAKLGRSPERADTLALSVWALKRRYPMRAFGLMPLAPGSFCIEGVELITQPGAVHVGYPLATCDNIKGRIHIGVPVRTFWERQGGR